MARTARLRQNGGWIKWAAAGLIVVSVLVLAWALPLAQVVTAAAEWLERLGVWAPVVYGLLFVVATVLFVPGWIPTATAGAVFGIGVGFVTASLGSTCGAMTAYLIARYLAREKVAAIAERSANFNAIDRAVGEGGWKIVALLRLSPIVPFNLQNYVYGLTQIRFWPCLMATWLAMLPGTFVTVYVGHLAGTAFAGRRRTFWEWGMLIVGLLLSATVTVYVTLLARRKLREQTFLDERRQAAEDEQQAWGVRRRGNRSCGPMAVAAMAVLSPALACYATWNAEAVQCLQTRGPGPPPLERREDTAPCLPPWKNAPDGASVAIRRLACESSLNPLENMS